MVQRAQQTSSIAKIAGDYTGVVGNAWKVAPGDHAYVWDECRDSGCITINWLNDRNFNDFASEQEIRQALPKKGDGSRGAPSIWQFVNDIQIGDVVVANNGLSHVEGIGVVTSDYLHPRHRDNPRRKEDNHCHARLVEWQVMDRIDLRRQLFIRPTVESLDSLQCHVIKRAYLKQSPELKKTLDMLLPDDSQCAQAADVDEISNSRHVSSTTKKALIDARLGQGRFRKDVLHQWGQRCAVCSAITQKAIRASHIKPWRDSTNDERLDPNNGLPLVASLDALFDVGLISFESTGRMIISPNLSGAERKIFGIVGSSLTKRPKAKMAAYLADHRRRHGFEP